MEWIIVERPGYLGKHREERHQEWNEKYGKGNWRLVWKVGKIFVDFLGACALYEDAYMKFLRNNPKVLHTLINKASNVYDDAPSNVNSVFDYTKQESRRTHLQDIAIRRSLLRLGLWFMGKELIRIRQERGTHPLSMILSPGRVPFHRPDLIVQPEVIKWWHPGTVESFYQSNRFLQAKKAELRIGVVGYCPPTKFDEVEARHMIVEAYDQIEKLYPDTSKAVVSGLTNVGVLKIAYQEAQKRKWRTVGIACAKVTEHELFPVDEKIIVGENWGDESSAFLSAIDLIIRIGTGKQSITETEETKRRGKRVLEYDLPALN